MEWGALWEISFLLKENTVQHHDATTSVSKHLFQNFLGLKLWVHSHQPCLVHFNQTKFICLESSDVRCECGIKF